MTAVIVWNGHPYRVRSADGAEGEPTLHLSIEPLTVRDEAAWALERDAVTHPVDVVMEVVLRRVLAMPIAPDDRTGDEAMLERRSGEALFKADVVALLRGKRL